MLSKIQKIFNILFIVFVGFAELVLIALVVIIGINVVLRKIFSISLQWGEVIPSFVMMPAFIMICIAIGVKEKLHININVLPRKLPDKFEFFLKLLKYSCIGIIGGVFIYHGFVLIIRTRTSVIPPTQLPNSIQYVTFPLAGILLIYESIMNIFGFEKDDEHLSSFLSGETDTFLKVKGEEND